MSTYYLVVAIAITVVLSTASLGNDVNELTRDVHHEQQCALLVAVGRLSRQSGGDATRKLGLQMLAKLLEEGFTNLEPAIGADLFDFACGKNAECRRKAQEIIVSRAKHSNANTAVEQFLVRLFRDPNVYASPDGITAKEGHDLIHAYLYSFIMHGRARSMGAELRIELASIDLSPYGKANPPPLLVQLKIWALRRLAMSGDVPARNALIEIARRYSDFTLLWGIGDEEAIELTKFTYDSMIVYEMEIAREPAVENEFGFLALMFKKYSKYYSGSLEERCTTDLGRFIPFRTYDNRLTPLALDTYLRFVREPRIPPIARSYALSALSSVQRAELDNDNARTEKYLLLLEELSTDSNLGNEKERRAAALRISEALRIPSK